MIDTRYLAIGEVAPQFSTENLSGAHFKPYYYKGCKKKVDKEEDEMDRDPDFMISAPNFGFIDGKSTCKKLPVTYDPERLIERDPIKETPWTPGNIHLLVYHAKKHAFLFFLIAIIIAILIGMRIR